MSDQNAQNLRAQIEARGALEEMRLLRQEAERHGDTVMRDRACLRVAEEALRRIDRHIVASAPCSTCGEPAGATRDCEECTEAWLEAAAANAQVWVVQSNQGEDDYGDGNEGEPVLWAVCTSAAKARELARGLWGNTSPEIPKDVTVTQVETDVVLS